ncbi:hypothetical protein CDAR_21651 [Caerostris darwini]|uniref:Uncharacterized protein n=1 Tax=Caerostris darwini TaxID=1538125 RepID=A0AAV4VFB8_9ARAC|nr:hypothetical protein CDAR_21651 [Caerostris darwini]
MGFKHTACVRYHHDSLAQKVESNHSDSHQLRIRSPRTRPLALIWATLEVYCLIKRETRAFGVCLTQHAMNTTMSPSPRRWNRPTLTLIRYGLEARTPDHWRSSERH